MEARDEHVLSVATDRFERRLAEEVGKVRVEIADLRSEVRTGFAEVRVEFAKVRGEFAHTKADLMRWMFLFWVGQVAVVFGLATVLR